MADIGSATVRVTPNMTGIQGKIAAGFKGAAGPGTKALGDEVNSNSSPFQSAIGKLGGFAKAGGIAIAAGFAAGAAGLVALTTKSLKAGAELEQQLGGSEAVFGEYAKGIQDKAREAYSQAGLSQSEYLQGANKMGALLQGSGISIQQSMDMSTKAIKRASDVASIMGVTTQEALDAVTGASKGNFTMMDNLGVKMNETSLSAAALAQGLSKPYSELSEGEKLLVAQKVFMEQTTYAAGNYAKENDTLAGSINTTKKAFEDFMATGNVTGFVESLVNTIKIAVPKIIELMPKLVDGIVQIVQAIVPALSAALPTLIPALISAVVSLIQAIVAAMPMIVQALLAALPMLIKGFIQLFMAIVEALPQIITMIAEALPEVIKSIVDGLTSPEALTSLIMGAIELFLAIIKAIPIIIIALVDALPVIIDNIIKTITSTKFINMMIGATIELFMALVKAIPTVIGSLLGALGKIMTTIGEALSPSKLGQIGGDMIRGLWNGIRDLGSWIKSKIGGFGADILNNVKSFFGINSPSTVFADIGMNLNKGLAKGLDGSAGLVTKSMNSMTNDALSAVIDPMLSPSLSMGSIGGSASPLAGASSVTQQEVNIQQVSLGDAGAVQEFFKQLNQDTINIGMGMTPIQGAI